MSGFLYTLHASELTLYFIPMFVCVCSAVSDSQIENAIDEGITSFEAMQDELGVAKTCGTCSCDVKALLQKKLNKTLAARNSLAAIITEKHPTI